MSSTPKKLRKRDIAIFVIIIAAILAVVFGISWAVEHLSGKTAHEGNVTTPPVVTEPEQVTTEEPTTETEPPATEPEPTTTEATTTEAPETTTTEATTTEAPATTPEPTTAPPATTAQAVVTTAAPETVSEQLTMPDDEGAPAEAKSAEELEDEIPDDYSITGYNNNIKNIVLIGVDIPKLGKNTYYRTGGQSDTVMILSMNLKAKEYFLVSINRDLVVPVENFSKYGDSYGFVDEQIALAYAYGDGSRESGKNVIKSLNYLFAETVPFLGYVAAPTTIIGTLADAVDGVPVLIVDDFSGVDDSLKIGEVANLKGEQAERYIRARKYMKNDPYNEFRMTRQFAFCEAFINKAKTTMTAKQLISVYEDVMGMLMTDMGKSDVTKWIATLYDYDFKGFYRLDGEYADYLLHNAPCRYIGTKEVMELVTELYYKKAE